MTDTLREKKTALRREIRARAERMTEEYRRNADAAIRRAVLQSEAWQRAESVFLYVSTRTEPDTRGLLADALREGKALYVPLCRADKTMEAVRVRSLAELRPGMRGIPEPPEDGERAQAPDLAVVPCVSASRDGRRLGHGAGYYDRFLEKTPCRTLCLCYEALLSDEIPTDEHDVRMDAVATEKRMRK